MLKQEITRGYNFLKKKGVKSTIIRTKRHLKEQRTYKKWIASDEARLEKQSKIDFKYKPKISIVVPLYNTPIRYLKELLDSVSAQTYLNWELCLADGTARETEITKCVKRYSRRDSRIKYEILDENKGISGNTNKAMEMATGEFIALADHDDILSPSALFEIVASLNRNRNIDVIYTDEDKTDERTTGFYMPHFKPDFNVEYFQVNNYICHFFVVRRTIAIETGGFDSEFDGAQDYDFIWKCIEKAETIHHIPKVLYHWRCHMDSTAGRPESKLYAYENGVKAVKAHYERCGIDADVCMYEDAYGYYRTTYKQTNKEKVTILYVGKGEESITTRYPHDEVRINGYDIDQINKAIKEQNNKYVLILDSAGAFESLNNLKTMVSYCRRDDVAAVGARIYKTNKRLMFGGFILGAYGYFGYAFSNTDIKDRGYYLRICVPQETMAVCGNCMMIDADVFKMVGGFDNTLTFNMSVADYCMKIRRDTDKRIVYVPDVIYVMYKEINKKYSKGEINCFKERWSKEIEKGDPFYNKNLTLRRVDYSLRKKGIKN